MPRSRSPRRLGFSTSFDLSRSLTCGASNWAMQMILAPGFRSTGRRAPTAVVVKSWACKRAWEGTVMDCLTAAGCRLILNEVFECDSLDELLARGGALFGLLGDPAIRPPLSEVSPHNK